MCILFGWPCRRSPCRITRVIKICSSPFMSDSSKFLSTCCLVGGLSFDMSIFCYQRDSSESRHLCKVPATVLSAKEAVMPLRSESCLWLAQHCNTGVVDRQPRPRTSQACPSKTHCVGKRSCSPDSTRSYTRGRSLVQLARHHPACRRLWRILTARVISELEA